MNNMLDMVVGTPRIMGRMGVGTPNLHIQWIQVESLTGLVTVSESQRCLLMRQESAITADVCYTCLHV